MLRMAFGALVLSASCCQAAQLCSGPGDREWTVDGKTIKAKLNATMAVGVLKDVRELNRGKRWLVEFPGGRAFLTITDEGRYSLLNEDGSKTEGACVSRSARRPS